MFLEGNPYTFYSLSDALNFPLNGKIHAQIPYSEGKITKNK